MLDKGNFAARIALLLEPRNSKPMRLQTGHDIIETIAVHIVDAYRRAAAAEIFRMIRPGLPIAARGGLLPPPRVLQNILAPVPVDIAYANAVNVHGCRLVRNRMN